MALDDFKILRLENLTSQFPNPLGYVSAQNRIAVFRDQNKVIYDIVNRVARLPVVLHTATILKSSPESEGFSPNPRGGNRRHKRTQFS